MHRIIYAFSRTTKEVLSKELSTNSIITSNKVYIKTDSLSKEYFNYE